MALTEDQKQNYLKGDSGKCPYCGDSDITGGFVEISGNQAWQECGCSACDASWTDIYTLSDVE